MAEITTSVDRERLAELCHRYRIQKLELFGSRVRGEEHPGSDVDQLVTFEPGTDLGLQFFGLGSDLEALFGLPVDLVERLVVERDRNPYFRRSVLDHTEVLYAA